MTLTPQQWEQVQTAELSRKAYQYACFLLDNRGYSYQEMFRKLEPKYPQAVCFATVDRLAKYGQINDRAYAEQLAHHYVAVKRFGMRRAFQEMRRRGLLEEHITEALEPYEDEVSTRTTAAPLKRARRHWCARAIGSVRSTQLSGHSWRNSWKRNRGKRNTYGNTVQNRQTDFAQCCPIRRCKKCVRDSVC